MVQAYLEYIICGALLFYIIALFIITIILGTVSHKIKKINKQITQIVIEVNNYIDHVVESEEMLQKEEKKQQIKEKNDKENRIINTVLEEIFQ